MVIIAALVYYYFFGSMLLGPTTQYIYIDNDDTVDSVCNKLAEISKPSSMTGFRTLVRHTSYSEDIHTGRYEITKSNGPVAVFHKLKSGLQAPVSLTVPQ